MRQLSYETLAGITLPRNCFWVHIIHLGEGGGEPNASEHKVAFESLKLAAAATNLHGLGDLLRQTNG